MNYLIAVLRFLLLFAGWAAIILLVLLILVLFVPVRYRLRADVKDEGSREEPDFSRLKDAASCRAEMSWLFGFLRCRLDVPSDEDGPVVYILFIPIRPLKILGRRRARKDKKPDNEAQRELDRDRQEKESAAESKKAAASSNKAASESNEAAAESNEAAAESTEASEPAGNSEGLKRTSKKSEGAFRILELIRDPELERARSIVLKQVLKVLKMLLPKKWSVDADLGLGNPYDTAKILEAAGMMYPVLQGHVRITPEFDIYRFNAVLKASGRLYLFMAVIAALTVLFDRDTAKLRKELKKFRG